MIENDQFADRKATGLLICCAAVFLALFVINFIDFIKKNQANKYIEWDVKTITAGDYAVEFDIDPEFFKDYLKKAKNQWIEKAAQQNRHFLSRVQSF